MSACSRAKRASRMKTLCIVESWGVPVRGRLAGYGPVAMNQAPAPVSGREKIGAVGPFALEL